MLSQVLEDKNEKLFDELVPFEGKAWSVAGELVRAVNRIGYRFWNDGDQIGIEYGNETCNAAARYIMYEFPDTEMDEIVASLWGLYDEKKYETGVERLVASMVEYLENNPKLMEEESKVEFFQYRENDDIFWEEEDDEWYEEEEENEDEWEEDEE